MPWAFIIRSSIIYLFCRGCKESIENCITLLNTQKSNFGEKKTHRTELSTQKQNPEPTLRFHHENYRKIQVCDQNNELNSKTKCDTQWKTKLITIKDKALDMNEVPIKKI